MYTPQQIRALIARGRLHEFYNDRYWRRLSHQIIAEHDHDCMLCRQQGHAGTAVLTHHVRHLKDFPELAYSRTYRDAQGDHIQLMPLCYDCHERIHKRGIYAEPKGYTNEELW